MVLGLVQGATEFAPISSSGHLILVPWLFGWTTFSGNPDMAKTFDVALHMGTLAGALIYFWRDVARYVAAWFRSLTSRRTRSVDERLAWFLVIGTIPGVIVGAAAESFIQERLGQPWLIAVMLAVFGIVLYVVDRRARRTRDLPDLTMKDALLIGVAQAVALQPGVSRSGVTMTMARGVGLDRPAAARFSFLLSLPIIAGAGVFKAIDLFSDGLPAGAGAAFFWGIVASAISGFAAIWGLLAYLRRRDFAPFVWYRLVAAAVVFGIIAAGVRPASGV
ncbi:MAG TPA: undecaprenyl-diphosphate phosphatase [Actinomycetota bacterium]|nr:undecaprenyl-diphosphate phosphatase [Actinomycetota bacterium]